MNLLKSIFTIKNCCLFLLIVFGFFWLDRINIKNWRFDDSFFGYTYAQNLTEGHGFTFNQNKIIGTSAPLPVFLYSAVKNVLPNYSIQSIAEYLNIIFIIISGLLLFLIVDYYTKSTLIALTGSLLLYSNIFYLMMFGHESIIAILLVLISTLLVLKKKYLLSAIIIGLAFLCRAESLAVLPFLFYEMYKNKKIKYLPFFLIPIIIWEIFSFIYFGQLTSNSFSFKVFQSQLSNAKFFPSLIEWINLIFIPKYFNWFILSLGILGICLSIGSFLILNLCLLVVPLAFYSFINIAFYHWFLFLASISIILGLTQFLKKYKSKTILFCIIIIASVYSSLQTTQNYAKTLPYPRDFMYKTIGEYLNKNSNRSDSVAFVEIGQIAYFSKNKIVDVTGITNQNILNELKKSNICYAYDFYQPKYIIYDPAFNWLTNPFKCDFVIKNYQLIHQFDSTSYRSLYLYSLIK